MSSDAQSLNCLALQAYWGLFFNRPYNLSQIPLADFLMSIFTSLNLYFIYSFILFENIDCDFGNRAGLKMRFENSRNNYDRLRTMFCYLFCDCELLVFIHSSLQSPLDSLCLASIPPK